MSNLKTNVGSLRSGVSGVQGQVFSPSSELVSAGTSSTSLEVGSGASTSTYTNALAVGNSATATANNAIVVGDNSTSAGICVGTASAAPANTVVVANALVIPNTDAHSVYIQPSTSGTVNWASWAPENNVVVSGGQDIFWNATTGFNFKYNTYVGAALTLVPQNTISQPCQQCVAVGQGNYLGGTSCTAVGAGAQCLGNECTAIGAGSQVGNANISGHQGSTAVGCYAASLANYTTTIGYTAQAYNANSVCIGANATDNAAGSVSGGLNLRVGTAVTVAAAGASDAYLNISINGTVYKLLLHT